MVERWEIHFSEVVQSTLLKLVLDHVPVLLDRDGMRRGKYVVKGEGIKELLKGWWMILVYLLFILVAKLKALK